MPITSQIKSQRLYVNGNPVPAAAYMTYFTDNNRYADFAEAGNTLFTIPVFFAAKTINESSQCPVFGKGIFDGDVPDFSVLDDEVKRITDVCKDAMIFPRVNVSLPQWWEDANPDELNDTGTSKFPESRRPCFSSDKWADEVKRLLALTVEHIEASEYRDNIIGYQIAGGNTEEWFSYDMKGSIGLRSCEKFAESVKNGRYTDTEADYFRFLSDMTARRICEFAAHIKALTDRRLTVGTFYGYTYECPFRESVHHSLAMLLDCADIDFICSPVSYANTRSTAFDHAYMLPIDSLKLHGKLYFSENDTRTHLSKAMCDLPHYNVPIWFGPDADTTCGIMKMHFARALIHGHGYWWFDMWGGWYDDKRYMKLIRRFCELMADSASTESHTEAAFFVDEEVYAQLSGSDAAKGQICSSVRNSLGRMGLPYAKYLASDFDAVYSSFKAVILAEPIPTPKSEHIKKVCSENNIPCLVITPDNAAITPCELRDFCRESGCRVICDRDAVVYYAGKRLFVHAVDDGEYVLDVGGTLTDMLDGNTYGNTLTLRKGESRLFEITK